MSPVNSQTVWFHVGIISMLRTEAVSRGITHKW